MNISFDTYISMIDADEVSRITRKLYINAFEGAICNAFFDENVENPSLFTILLIQAAFNNGTITAEESKRLRAYRHSVIKEIQSKRKGEDD